VDRRRQSTRRRQRQRRREQFKEAWGWQKGTIGDTDGAQLPSMQLTILLLLAPPPECGMLATMLATTLHSAALSCAFDDVMRLSSTFLSLARMAIALQMFESGYIIDWLGKLGQAVAATRTNR
jgi:hypothetical protein